MKKNYAITLLVLIVLLGGFLRFYKLGATAFDRDEFFELNSSYGYFKTGNFMAWDFGLEKPFLADMQDDSSNERAEIFRWQLAQLYHFAEPSEALTRGLGATWGVIGIILVYFIAVSLTGNVYIGLIAAFLTAVGQSEIIYSRRLRMYAMFFPVYLLFSWTVFKFYESKYGGKIKFFKKISEKIGFNFAYFVPVLIAGFVSYNTHILTVHIAAVVAVYAFVFFLISLWKKSYFNKYSLTITAIVVGLVALKFVPFFYQVYPFIKKNIKLFRHNYKFFSEYFTDFNYIFVGVILIVFGSWFLARKMKREKEAAFLFLSVAVPLALAIFTWKRDVSQRYIYFLQSFCIILSAIGIYGIINLAIEKVKNYNYKKIAALALVIVFLFSIDFSHISFKNSTLAVAKSSSYYPDFGEVFDFVKKNRKSGDVMITRTYRSFYWRGENIKTYELRKLETEAGVRGCQAAIGKIAAENKSGWVVFPKVDNASICSGGKKYFDEHFKQIEDKEVPSSVRIYQWGK